MEINRAAVAADPRADGAVAGAAGSGKFVQWLDTARDLASLGGKAGPLARLAAAGLPVPPGFVIAPQAFVAEGETAAPGHDPLWPAAADEIRRAYAELGRRLGHPTPRVAVRSSAAAEDLAGASFAGQHDTFLAVSGEEDLLAYTGRCWASLWSEHAQAYRAHHEQRSGRALPAPAMAVLVQQLVEADAAGVAFTAHPITGDRSRVLVNAAWGLGQSIVDGEVEADTWLLDRETPAAVERTVGLKRTRTGAGPETPREPVPEHLQRAPSLTDEQASAVAALALQAEAAIGAPADVEWAIAGEKVWLLQARPITTGAAAASPNGAAESEAVAAAASVQPSTAAHRAQPAAPPAPAGPTPAFPFEWPDADAATLHWKLQSIDQRRPEVLRPLEQDVRTIFNRSLKNAATIAGRPRFVRAIYLNGYEYVAEVVNPAPESELKLHAEAFQRVGTALAARGESYRTVVQFPAIDAGNARLLGVDVDALPAADLAAHLEEALQWYEQLWTMHWTSPPDSPRNHFVNLYKELFPPAGGATAGADEDAAKEQIENEVRPLLEHESNLLTEAVDGLVGLARIAQQHAALRELCVMRPADDVLAALPETPGGGEFRAALDRLLETQGLRSGAGFGTERTQLLPGWCEQPALVVALVQKYVPQDLETMMATRHRAIAARDGRVAGLRERIADPAQRERFDFWLAAARRQQQGFEDHNLKIDSAASTLLHRAISACARRLAAAGALGAADDVWWLHAHEVVLAVRGLAGEPDGGRWTEDDGRKPKGEGRGTAGADGGKSPSGEEDGEAAPFDGQAEAPGAAH